MNLREIAQETGVSLTAVSLVLNGKAGVGQEKREQVRRLLTESGYQIRSVQAAETPSRKIRFLKYSKHAYLVNGNPGFVTQIMDSAERVCRRHGYDLTITACDDFGSVDLGELLRDGSVKGAILLGTEIDDADMCFFRDLSKPLVVVDNSLSLLPFSTVTMDNRTAVFSAVRHLLELGHRQVGFLYNSIPSNNDRERRAAFEEALGACGRRFDPALVYPIFPTMDGAWKSAGELLRGGARFPSALVANNDSIAIGALRAFRDCGLCIPDDISVVGFDGLPFSAVSEPPLTTVRVPCGDIGYWAVRLLHEHITGKNPAPCKILVGTELTVRGSTAAWHRPRAHPSLLPEERRG